MMALNKIYITSIAALLHLVFLSSCNSKPRVEVQIYSIQASQAKARFTTELALTPSERAQGLMFRKELGRDRGMLFIFPHDVMNAFWMQNTLIELDIIFIDSEKKIVSIVHRAQPQTTSPREPKGFYRYVLEIEGGLAENLEIGPGDRIDFTLPAGIQIQ